MPRLRGLTLTFALVMATACATHRRPATNCPRAPRRSDTTVYLPCHTRPAPLPLPGFPQPQFPEILLSAGVQGQVRVSFVVDTAGFVMMETYRVLRSDHDLFTSSVRAAVDKWRYQPGAIKGRRVRVRMDTTYSFEIRDDQRISIVSDGDRIGYPSSDTTPDGWPRRVRFWPERDLRAVADSQMTREAKTAVLREITDDFVNHTVSTLVTIVCIEDQAGPYGDPDPEVLRGVASARIAPLPSRRCPPVFNVVVRNVTVDLRTGKDITLPDPPGDNPHVMTILRFAAWTPTSMVVEVEERYSASWTRSLCLAEVSSGKWKSDCRTRWSRIF